MALKQLNLKKIENSIVKEAKQILFRKIVSFNNKFQKIAKESVADVEAIDTGLLQARTIHQVLPSNPAQITNKIVISYQTRNINYAQYVYFGLGSNRKYGARKFNLISAEKTKDLLENGSYNRTLMKGGSNSSGLTTEGGLKKYRKNLRKTNEIKKLGIGSIIKGTRGNIRKGILKSARGNFKRTNKK